MQEYSELTDSSRRPSKPYYCSTLHRFSRGIRPYDFSRSTKHAYASVENLKIFQIWSVILRLERKPHMLSSCFGSIDSRHLYSGHFTYISEGSLRREMPDRWCNHSCPLCKAMITPVCECFGVLPEHQSALHTHESAKQLLGS